jgi:hypothetical protein
VEEWLDSGADPMSKTVSVMDVFFANRGSLTDPNYDPNVDDPLNQIRHMTLDEKREIMRRESVPFESIQCGQPPGPSSHMREV